MRISQNEEPELNLPDFTVDKQLDEKLNQYEITKLMNKSNMTVFLGRAGSGKTSIMISFIKTKELFFRVYHTIFLFMPTTSRASIKDDFLNKKIPEDQIFDEINIENLEIVESIARENAEENYNTLLIFDDVQKYFRKNKQLENYFLGIVNNRRHLRVSIWLCNQNYKLLNPNMRSGITDMFIFNIKKKEKEELFKEIIELDKDETQAIINIQSKAKQINPYSFLYVNIPSQRIFINWDEIHYMNDED